MTVESSWDGASREPLAVFAELSKIMLGDGSLNETLGRIPALVRETVPDTDEVSVTLVGVSDGLCKRVTSTLNRGCGSEERTRNGASAGQWRGGTVSPGC